MLKTRLLHPQILAALGAAGHGSKILISDGNFPHATKRGPNAALVFANFAPGVLGAADVLKLLLSAVPVESAAVMATLKTGPYAMKSDPPIWKQFRAALKAAGAPSTLQQIERFDFYDAASHPDVCLTVATGETAIYANLLLTIGVVK